jgi:hypothetical protein
MRGTPDPEELMSMLSASEKIRISAYNRSKRANTNINPYEYAEAVAATKVNNPFEAIPLAASKGEFSPPAYEVIPFFGEGLDDTEATSMEHYAWDERGYQYGYGGDDLSRFIPASSTGHDTSAAPITVKPTATTNPERPRTVAAGYDFAQQKITVIFRDGTYYNYYMDGLSKAESNRIWQNFKRSRSKGRFILTYLDQMNRGPADSSSVPTYAREVIYRFLRTGQTFRGGMQPGHSKGSKRGTGTKHNIYKPGNLGGTGRKRTKSNGKNT